MLLGGVAGGGAALATVRKAAAKTRAAAADKAKSPPSPPVAKPNPPVQEAAKKGSFSGWGLTQAQEKLLNKKIAEGNNYVRFEDLAVLRGAGISMDDIAKAFKLPKVKTERKNYFEEKFTQLKEVKKLLGQTEDLSVRQVEGLGDLMDSVAGWETIVRGIRKTGLSADDALSLRSVDKRITIIKEKNNYTPQGLKEYMQKRKGVENYIGTHFTERQSRQLGLIQMYFREGAKGGISKTKERNIRAFIKNLSKSGLREWQIREMAKDLISHNPFQDRYLKSLIDESL